MSNKGPSVNINGMNSNNHNHSHNHNHNMNFDRVPANTKSQVVNHNGHSNNGGFLGGQLNGIGLSNSGVYVNNGKDKLSFLS